MREIKEATRKLLGVALCDLIAYIGSVGTPFVIGGQYPNDRLIEAYREWLNKRRFDIEGVSESSKIWLEMCAKDMFCPKGIKPGQSQPPKKPVIGEVDISGIPTDDIPNKGYFAEDDWKPENERPKNWEESGEGWKDKDEEDATNAG
jgi:hypothetical protein